MVSLGDISIYTYGDDKPLPEVLEALKTKTGGQPVDLKAIGSDNNLREYFGEVLSDYDRERVYTADIKKLIKWYNQLIAAGITEFVKSEEAAEAPAAEGEPAAE